MKRIALLLLLFTGTSLNAQISINEVEKWEEVGRMSILGTPYWWHEKKDDLHLFSYRDMNYTHIVEVKSFTINDVDDAIKNFYSTLRTGVVRNPDKDIEIETKNARLVLVFKGKSVVIHHYDKKSGIHGYTTRLNAKQLDKLFGYKK